MDTDVNLVVLEEDNINKPTLRTGLDNFKNFVCVAEWHAFTKHFFAVWAFGNIKKTNF